MEKRADVRIVTVFYSRENAEYFLSFSFPAIRKLKIPLTVVDNGDNSKLIDSDSGIDYIKNSVNKGYGSGANIGIAEAKEEFVLLANDDTLLSEKFLCRLIENLSFYSKSDYAIVGFRIISKHSQKAGIHMIPYNPFIILYHFSVIPFMLSLFSRGSGYIGALESIHAKKSSKEVKGVNGSVMLLNREKFNSLLGFDEEYFLTYEETDLFIRALKMSMKIYYDSALTAKHKHSLTSGSKSLEYSFSSMMIFLRKHYGKLWSIFIYAWIYLYLILKKAVNRRKHGNEIEFLKKS